MQRRSFLTTLLAATAAASVSRVAFAASPLVEVYKNASCGCCGSWVDHLRSQGFAVKVTEVADVTPYRVRAGVPAALASCHTGLVDGYAIEGHVPAADIRRLLRERPVAGGLAAPGMPAGAPGMDMPHAPAYDVLLFQRDGTTRIFHAYPAA